MILGSISEPPTGSHLSGEALAACFEAVASSHLTYDE